MESIAKDEHVGVNLHLGIKKIEMKV